MHRRHTFSPCTRRVCLAILVLFSVSTATAGEQATKSKWFKGTTHAHSFWSDGDQCPELVVDWFKSHGYDFFALTDHNSINKGEQWRKVGQGRRPVTQELLDQCAKRFGPDWVVTRGEGKNREVRLKTYEEINSELGEPGRFLFIRGNEISTTSSGKPAKCVHLCGLNLQELIKPVQAPTVTGTMRANIRAAEKQGKKLGQPVLTHINHPNFAGYSITARDLAEVPEVRFVEVCNNHNGIKHYGDKTHPSVERVWDIANTIRLIEKKTAPIYGVATDDSHNYHQPDPNGAIPGRGWVMVRSPKLEPGALFDAMKRGDFYGTTGVELAELDYNAKKGTLHVRVRPKRGTHYSIEFIGTPADLKLPTDANLNKTAEIGKVLASHKGNEATYRFKGDELYVRAAIRSDRRMAHPSATGVQNEEAWTQPVGWDKAVVSSR